MKEKKSDEHYITIPPSFSTPLVKKLVKASAEGADLYISHIGAYNPQKYTGSIHWHFKRDKNERGLIDATYWKQENKFWLTVRHREPQWVKDATPLLIKSFKREIKKLRQSQ